MGTVRDSWRRYAVSWAEQHGGYDPRRAPAPARVWQRLSYGLGRTLRVLRVGPGVVTAVGLGLAVAVPYLAARGGVWPLAAAGLVLLSALAGSASTAVTVLGAGVRGPAAVREAVAARLVETAWLVSFWVAGVAGALVVAAGLVSGLHEYIRVLARAAGVAWIGPHTMGERPMRVTVAVVGLAVAGLAGDQFAAGVLTIASAVWLLLAALGLGQLVGAVRRRG
jgi:CDP-diacylglycerol--glycerol-3-phosphate 3-phosphatidyltransferase